MEMFYLICFSSSRDIKKQLFLKTIKQFMKFLTVFLEVEFVVLPIPVTQKLNEIPIN
jgi:hypothetical protein